MDDEHVENNMANDDFDHGPRIYDDLLSNNDTAARSEPNRISDTDGNSDAAQTSLGPQANGNYEDPNLWSADRLKEKMGENMARAEALTDDNPLRTENTPSNNDNKYRKII